MLKHMGSNEALRRIPTILMSCIPEATVAERCAGYTLFMRKPFSIFEVLDIVGRVAAPAD